MVTSHIPSPPSKAYLAAREVITSVLDTIPQDEVIAMAEAMRAAARSRFGEIKFKDHGVERRAPRPENERIAGPDEILRCAYCDWQAVNGEGVEKTRSCCVAGLQSDLNLGMTPVPHIRTKKV